MRERQVTVHRLGRVEYEDGLTLQQRFGEALARKEGGDALLLLEHPPVLTLGRAATRANILASADVLRSEGIWVFETNRGGEVTYHGPGQVVGYPIFDLAPDRQDVRRYVRDVEEAVIRALHRFGLTAGRSEGRPGVWLEGAVPEKVAAIGVHLSRWRTSHGFALNVRPDLSHFELIVPCGLRGAGVTSMEKRLGRPVAIADVERALAESFGEVFGASILWAPPPAQTVAVAVRRDDKVLLLRRVPSRGGFWQPITGKVEPGEAVAEAARRELEEETGRALSVEPLHERHAFAFGDTTPPRVLEEHAFIARWPDERAPAPDPREHDAFEWVGLTEALTRLPFPGLRRTVSLALERG